MKDPQVKLVRKNGKELNYKKKQEFYMDDLELNEKNFDDVKGLLKTVKSFSDDGRMKIGLDKCTIVPFKKSS